MKVVKHEMQDRSFVGTPRPLPRVLMCHVPKGMNGCWCGRHWTANTMDDYHVIERLREVHQRVCGTLETL